MIFKLTREENLYVNGEKKEVDFQKKEKLVMAVQIKQIGAVAMKT